MAVTVSSWSLVLSLSREAVTDRAPVRLSMENIDREMGDEGVTV